MKTFVIATFAAVITLFGCFGCGETTTGPGQAEGFYLGKEACRQCHSTAYNAVLATKHTRTFVDDPDNPYDFISIWTSEGRPQECLECHTTGWDPAVANHGADEEAYRKNMVGVQCEECHGPGSEHVAGGGDPSKISLDFSAELCGRCHHGDHNPNYDEWKTSKHAEALEALKESNFANDECLECHSADYWWDRTVTLETAQYPITCAMCHMPHGSNFQYQLRENGAALCSLCHTDEAAQPPQTPHHPQDEMLTGIGGYEWPQGGPYFNDEHTYVVEERCITCHMYSKPFENNNPAIKGHTWRPTLDTCQPCHPGTTTFDIDGAQTDITELLADLKADLDTQQNENEPNYVNAKYDYNFVNNDKSKGVHNYKYAKQLLEDSLEFYTPSKTTVARGR